MRMAATVVAAGMTFGTAYVLYTESVETRGLEQQVRAQEQTRDRLETEIAALKARRAHLSRPGRIEPAARAIGMEPGSVAGQVMLGDIMANAAGPDDDKRAQSVAGSSK